MVLTFWKLLTTPCYTFGEFLAAVCCLCWVLPRVLYWTTRRLFR